MFGQGSASEEIMKIPFGKYKNKTLKQVKSTYLCWLLCFYKGTRIPEKLVEEELIRRGKDINGIKKEAIELLKTKRVDSSGFLTDKGRSWVRESIEHNQFARGYNLIAVNEVMKNMKPIESQGAPIIDDPYDD